MHLPLRHTVTTSPLGDILLVAEDRDIVGVYFYDYRPEDTGIWVGPTDSTLEPLAMQIGQYFRGVRKYFTIDYVMIGEPFSLAVWDATAAIPYGQTRTYGEIAKMIGRPGAARAVGTALHRNPLSLLVPCHRVVKANGALSGYAGGLERKAALLELEAQIDPTETDRLF